MKKISDEEKQKIIEYIKNNYSVDDLILNAGSDNWKGKIKHFDNLNWFWGDEYSYLEIKCYEVTFCGEPKPDQYLFIYNVNNKEFSKILARNLVINEKDI